MSFFCDRFDLSAQRTCRVGAQGVPTQSWGTFTTGARDPTESNHASTRTLFARVGAPGAITAADTVTVAVSGRTPLNPRLCQIILIAYRPVLSDLENAEIENPWNFASTTLAPTYAPMIGEPFAFTTRPLNSPHPKLPNSYVCWQRAGSGCTGDALPQATMALARRARARAWRRGIIRETEGNRHLSQLGRTGFRHPRRARIGRPHG